MKIDCFYEIESANHDEPGFEYRLLKETLAQAEAAEAAGFDCWWQVEHHGAVGMSYSSAPDVILSAISQRTRRMRLGHSAVLAPHNFSHPIRIAERAATLDLLSDGRLELGFARSTIPEWRLFEIDADDTRAQLERTMRMVPQMWMNERFTWEDERFQIKDAPILPKPYQKPHPPLWQASSSPESFEMAGRNGVGALGVTLLTPLEGMAALLQMYRETIKDADPAGAYINNQTGVFTFVHCAETTKQAIENGAAEAAAWYTNTIVKFFELQEMLKALEGRVEETADVAGRALVGALDTPGSSDGANSNGGGARDEAISIIGRLARNEEVSGEEVYEVLGQQDSIIIGDPETCRKKMQHYKEIGVDRLLCFQQVGALSHESIMRSIELLGSEVIPHFSPK